MAHPAGRLLVIQQREILLIDMLRHLEHQQRVREHEKSGHLERLLRRDEQAPAERPAVAECLIPRAADHLEDDNAEEVQHARAQQAGARRRIEAPPRGHEPRGEGEERREVLDRFDERYRDG